MSLLVSSVVLQKYGELAASLRLNPLEQLERVDLRPDALERTDQFISHMAFIRLLENTAASAKCADFGFRLADIQKEKVAGPLYILMRYAESLLDAIHLGTQYCYVLSPALRASIDPVPEHPQWLDLKLFIQTASWTHCAQTTEYFLYGVVLLLRWVSNGKTKPLMVSLPHSRGATTLQYARYFGCECSFDKPVAAIRLASRDLNMVLPARNPLRLEMARSYIEQNFGNAKSLITDRVRVLVRQRMPMGSATQADIAEALAMHSKTLQRRLLAEDMRFDTLLDSERRHRFLELLMQPSRPHLAQIAQMVGYSEQAALTRSCRRWFGCSPSDLRDKQNQL